MPGPMDHCPTHWRPKCYPRKCPCPDKPVVKDAPPRSTHNILYLVDEHDVSDGRKPDRKSVPLRRYAWHHSIANLATFNVGEEPDTICLHDHISNPSVNAKFTWHGYMFDVPGGKSTCRIAIAAGACNATDDQLSGPVEKGKDPIDRVVGFAGTYVDNKIPIGIVTPVRRDDRYRVLNTFFDPPGKPKLQWHCAYYITKETPTKSSGFTGSFNLVPGEEGGNPDQPPATDGEGEGQHDEEVIAYDAMMDDTVKDEGQVAEGVESWGGNMFGFTIGDNVQPGSDEDGALVEYGGDALQELVKNSEAEATRTG